MYMEIRSKMQMTMTVVLTLHCAIASYRGKVKKKPAKSRWMALSKLYTVTFLTCGDATWYGKSGNKLGRSKK